MTNNTSSSSLSPRRIVHRTRGHGHGPITRLMSPSDLGQLLKPFVFLDLFNASGTSARALEGMPIHPHSGLATVTVLTEGSMRFDVPESGAGTIDYGGVEWLRASGGVWHGKEMAAMDVPRLQGFQLWLALPAALESAAPVSRYFEAASMVRSGPAHVIVGSYEGAHSPVPAPEGINYLLVTLRAGERWTYQPPAGHSIGWLALAKGMLDAGAGAGPINAGEMVLFEDGESAIELHAAGQEEAVFVLGSAVPHPHPLHLGYYSVHTSAQALEAGERRIAELGEQMQRAGDRRTASGTVPIFG